MGISEPAVELIDADERRTVAVRLKGRMADLDMGALIDKRIPELMEKVSNDHPSAPYLRSFVFGPDEYDLELGIPASDYLQLPDV